MDVSKIDIGEVAIGPLAYKKIMYLTELAGNNEIGGFLVVDIVNGEIQVQDVLIPKQEVSSAYWETEARDGSVNLVAELAKTKEGKEIIPKLRGWWHKHPMTGWSELDKETARQISGQAGFCVSINSDKGREIVVRLDMDKPFKFGVDEVDYKIRIIDPDTRKWCEEEFKKKVTERQYGNFQRADSYNRDFRNNFDTDYRYPKQEQFSLRNLLKGSGKPNRKMVVDTLRRNLTRIQEHIRGVTRNDRLPKTIRNFQTI